MGAPLGEAPASACSTAACRRGSRRADLWSRANLPPPPTTSSALRQLPHDRRRRGRGPPGSRGPGRRARRGALLRRGRTHRPATRPHPRRRERSGFRALRGGADAGRRRPAPAARPGIVSGARRPRRPPGGGRYCSSGVSAARDVLTLAVLGVDAALFPGSWSAWSTTPTDRRLWDSSRMPTGSPNGGHAPLWYPQVLWMRLGTDALFAT